MAQKILAGRASDPTLSGDLVEVKVDQVVLAKAPHRAFADALSAGLKKTTVEVAIAYDGRCVTDLASVARGNDDPTAVPSDMLAHGILVARAGVGFPTAVHLERFASPARLCVTDEPRLAGVGGAGMLALVLPPGQLGQALAQGSVWLRPPRSIQVLVSGRVRPFVCARDIALELVRRGLGEAIRRVEEKYQAPVVVEFAGPSVRLLSVGERAVMASLAPHLGAAGALFVSDERTEVFLRDQRRSKAHRALIPDAGAPCDEVLNVDLGAVDPLLLDDMGQVRAVRDWAGKPVAQVVLGGDSGTTLRDLLAAATLLKSKRVPARLDFLVAPPSRQALEVLASTGVLTDLVATGARILEPDMRVMRGELYPPPAGQLSLRTSDAEPRVDGVASFAVASAETLAYTVATGEIGDPRSFKRPVRVTVPRALPTDDVLILRERRGGGEAKPRASADGAAPRRGQDKDKDKDKEKSAAAPIVFAAAPWKGFASLDVVDAPKLFEGASKAHASPATEVAVLCATLDEVRRIAGSAETLAPSVRVVLAQFFPTGLAALLSGAGIAAVLVDAATAKALKGQKGVAFPPAAQWAESAATQITVGGAKLPLTWLARGVERNWVVAGTAKPAPAPSGRSRQAT